MKQLPETEFIKAKYTLHVDHTGYTALRHVTIVGYAKNGVPIPHGIRRHLKVVTQDNWRILSFHESRQSFTVQKVSFLDSATS
jgi:hypothetical protein